MRSENWGSRPRLYDLTASRLGKPAPVRVIVDFPAQQKEGAQTSQTASSRPTLHRPRARLRPSWIPPWLAGRLALPGSCKGIGELTGADCEAGISETRNPISDAAQKALPERPRAV